MFDELRILLEGGQGSRDEGRPVIGGIDLLDVGQHHPQRRGRVGIAEDFLERSQPAAGALDRAQLNAIGEPGVRGLPGRLELTRSNEHLCSHPRHAEGGGENRQHRKPKEELTLVGKADSGGHGLGRLEA